MPIPFLTSESLNFLETAEILGATPKVVFDQRNPVYWMGLGLNCNFVLEGAINLRPPLLSCHVSLANNQLWQSSWRSSLGLPRAKCAHGWPGLGARVHAPGSSEFYVPRIGTEKSEKVGMGAGFHAGMI